MAVELPRPDDEEVFIQTMLDADDADDARLIEAVELAMTARRPSLAGRLVQLVSHDLEVVPGSAVARARRAAEFLVLHKPRPEDNSWSELEDAWKELRQQRMRRYRKRIRATLHGRTERVRRLEGRKRRR